jgi:hypothetical protein
MVQYSNLKGEVSRFQARSWNAVYDNVEINFYLFPTQLHCFSLMIQTLPRGQTAALLDVATITANKVTKLVLLRLLPLCRNDKRKL